MVSELGWRQLIVTFAALVMAACGGGGDGAPAPSPPPVASAGADQTVPTGAVVSLNGSASTVSGGRTLSFTWTISSKPAGSSAVLTSATAVNPTLKVDVAGTYNIQLVVNDGLSSSMDALTVTASLTNSPPVANAGSPQNVSVGSAVSLDASKSNDPDGDPITYLWTINSRPAGSTASLSDISIPNPVFTPDISGNYVFQLVVNDGKTNSIPAILTISVSNSTPSPIANAGPNQSVIVGSLVNLDGSGSTNATGFAWSFTSKPAGSVATLVNPTASNPRFTPDLAGSYLVRLTVTNISGTNSSTVTITASNLTPPPVANAGPAQTVIIGTLVQLDGTASTNATDYGWIFTSKPAGSAAVLANTTSPKPTFTPEIAGSYVVKLTVINSAGISEATVTVTAIAPTPMPIANAGPDQSVTSGVVVTLNGAGSTNASSYSWRFTQDPGLGTALLNPATSSPTFTPVWSGIYVLELTVSNSSGSATDSVSITVSPPAPVAKILVTPGLSVSTNTLITLDGTTSQNFASTTTQYKWTLSAPAGSSATLSSTSAPKPTFTPDVAGTYSVQLVVNDGTKDSEPAAATVTATVANVAPVARIVVTPSTPVTTGTLVTLDGTTSSDANGDLLTYAWTLTGKPAGSAAVLLSATASKPTFTPDVAGTYSVQLVVNDGKVNSAAVAATVTATVANVAPVAKIVPSALSVTTGTLVILDGTTSSDANGDPLTYSWALTKPTGSVSVLSSATASQPTFTPDVAGTYGVQLIVSDSKLTSQTKADIAVNLPSPVANAGPAQTLSWGGAVTLDGTASTNASSYSWSYASKPTGSVAALVNATTDKPSFTPDLAGSYIVLLVVNNSTGSNSSTVTITVNPIPPIAKPVNTDPGADLCTGFASLNGSTSSTGGLPITYNWSLTKKPALSNPALSPSGASATLVVDINGDYEVTLIVMNSVGTSTKSIIVTASIPTNPGLNIYFGSTTLINPATNLAGTACASCHALGGADVTKTSTAPDLALKSYTLEMIKCELTTGSSCSHDGGKRTITNCQLKQLVNYINLF